MAIALPQVNIQIDKPDDAQTERDRFSRAVVAVAIGFVLIYIPWWLATYVGAVFGHPFWGKIIGLGAGFWLLSQLAPRFIVNNPEWTGYVTLNPFTGKMVPYGPGWHISFPWEERNKAGNFPLQVITREFTLTTPTKSSAVTIEGRVFYNASLKFISNAVGVDKEVVEEGLVAFIESFLTSTLADMDAEDALKKTTEISNKLNENFRDKPAPNGSTPEEFEQKIGYSTAAIVIDRIALPAAVQEANDALSEAKRMNDIAATLLGVSGSKLGEMIEKKILTPKQVKEMVDRALVTSGNAKMQLNVIEGDLGAAAANFLTQGDKK